MLPMRAENGRKRARASPVRCSTPAPTVVGIQGVVGLNAKLDYSRFFQTNLFSGNFMFTYTQASSVVGKAEAAIVE